MVVVETIAVTAMILAPPVAVVVVLVLLGTSIHGNYCCGGRWQQ